MSENTSQMQQISSSLQVMTAISVADIPKAIRFQVEALHSKCSVCMAAALIKKVTTCALSSHGHNLEVHTRSTTSCQRSRKLCMKQSVTSQTRFVISKRDDLHRSPQGGSSGVN